VLTQRVDPLRRSTVAIRALSVEVAKDSAKALPSGRICHTPEVTLASLTGVLEDAIGSASNVASALDPGDAKTSVGPGGRQLTVSGRRRDARSSRGGSDGNAPGAVAAEVALGTVVGSGVGASDGA